MRGGAWPWTIATKSSEVLWAKIVEYRATVTATQSYRALADALKSSSSTIERAIKPHLSEWEEINSSPLSHCPSDLSQAP